MRSRQITADKNQAVEIPPDLQKALRSHKDAATAFKALRIGNQREFANCITEAKRAETRQQRIEKILPMIIAGVGLNDKYRR